MSMFIRHGLSMLSSVLLIACAPPGPVVYVAVEFVAPKGTPPLSHMEIISGAEKTLGGGIEPGTVDHYRVYPGAASTDNELTVSVYLHPDTQRAIDWQGDRFPQGSSYKTHIRIDAKGQVLSQRSCVVPCEL
jgi:hypothetical protein